MPGGLLLSGIEKTTWEVSIKLHTIGSFEFALVNLFSCRSKMTGHLLLLCHVLYYSLMVENLLKSSCPILCKLSYQVSLMLLQGASTWCWKRELYRALIEVSTIPFSKAIGSANYLLNPLIKREPTSWGKFVHADFVSQTSIEQYKCKISR